MNNEYQIIEYKENLATIKNEYNLNDDDVKIVLDYLYSFSNIAYDFLNNNKYNFIENDKEEEK